jgi:hypothetical protein
MRAQETAAGAHIAALGGEFGILAARPLAALVGSARAAARDRAAGLGSAIGPTQGGRVGGWPQVRMAGGRVDAALVDPHGVSHTMRCGAQAAAEPRRLRPR